MRYFLIAGERSGDMHAARLINELKNQDTSAEIFAWGGEAMKAAGAKLLQHYREISFMGLWEVITNLSVISQKLKLCKNHVSELNPDVLILVDFPGFNLRMAQFGKTIGLKTSYYISPKIWAWKKSRIKNIRKYVDQMLVILPFEKKFYQQLGYSVTYVGNPLVEAIESYSYDNEFIDSFKHEKKNKVAFLPGSRQQEVIKAIAVIRELSKVRPDSLFFVAGVDNLSQDLYQDIASLENVSLQYNKTYELLKLADVAIVTSGTATLEAAIIGTRQVVVYKTSLLTYYIGRLLVNIKFISLVNLIAGKEVVKELIQYDYNAQSVLQYTDILLNDPEEIRKSEEGYREINKLLGKEKAAKNAASEIILLTEQTAD